MLSPEETVKPVCRTRQILLVDDSQAARRILRAILETLGLPIAEATDGRQALELISAFNFDLLVTDLEMAPLNGFALISRLRGLSRQRARPKIIICSALVGTRFLTEDAFPPGAIAAAIRKPVDPEALLKAAHGALGLA